MSGILNSAYKKPRQQDTRLDTRNERREADLDLRHGMSHATKC